MRRVWRRIHAAVQRIGFSGWFLAFAVTAIAARFSIASENLSFSEAATWRGIGSDIAAAAVWAALTRFVLRFAVLQAFGMALWCFILAGNRSHIISNASNMSIRQAPVLREKAFLLGSVLSDFVLVDFALALIIFIAVLLFACFLQRRFVRTLRVLTLLFALPVLALNTPLSIVHPAWVQLNLFEENIYIFPNHEGLDYRISNADRAMSAPYFAKNLNAPLFTSNPLPKPPNVLLIMIESLSSEHLIAGWTPHLEELSQRSLYYDNFITPTDTTINGLYATLCGDTPAFGPKLLYKSMKVGRSEGLYDCLPAVLHHYGYRTVYAQANDLQFEVTNAFMTNAGFDQIIGDKELPEGPRYTKWGIDDRQLFQFSLSKIDELQQGKTPWFYTIMTVGTHHPFNLPEDGLKMAKTKPEAAFRFMDKSLNEFLTQLEAKHVLDNTLIIISGDEAAKTYNGTRLIEELVKFDHGIAIVLTPDYLRKQIHTPYLQTDMMVSLLDYLKLPTRFAPIGRSLFRSYDPNSFRPMIFSKNLIKNVYVVPEPNRLIICNYLSRMDCLKYSTKGSTLFTSDYDEVEMGVDDEMLTRTLMAVNQKSLVKPFDPSMMSAPPRE